MNQEKFFIFLSILTILLVLLAIVLYIDAHNHLSYINLEDTTIISLSKNPTIVGEGAYFNDNTLTISQSGVYLVNGTLVDGNIEITTQDDVYLILNKVNLTSSGSVISKKGAGILVLSVSNDAENYLTSISDCVIKTEGPLHIIDHGNLSLKAENSHGILAKGNISIVSSSLSIIAKNTCLSSDEQVSIEQGMVYGQSTQFEIIRATTTRIEDGILITNSITNQPITNTSLELTDSYIISVNHKFPTQNFIHSIQPGIFLENISQNTTFRIEKNEKEVLTYKIPLNGTTCFISIPDFKMNDIYHLYRGEVQPSSTSNFYGLYLEDTTFSSSQDCYTFQLTSSLLSINPIWDNE